MVAAQGVAAGRDGDVLVASKAVEGKRDDDGVVEEVAAVGVLRGRDVACDDGVLDRRPL